MNPEITFWAMLHERKIKKTPANAGVKKNRGAEKGGNLGPCTVTCSGSQNAPYERCAQEIIPHTIYAKMHSVLCVIFHKLNERA